MPMFLVVVRCRKLKISVIIRLLVQCMLTLKKKKREGNAIIIKTYVFLINYNLLVLGRDYIYKPRLVFSWRPSFVIVFLWLLLIFSAGLLAGLLS